MSKNKIEKRKSWADVNKSTIYNRQLINLVANQKAVSLPKGQTHTIVNKKNEMSGVHEWRKKFLFFILYRWTEYEANDERIYIWHYFYAVKLNFIAAGTL